MSKLFGAVAKLSILSLCLLPPSLCERADPPTANSVDVYASVLRGVDGAVRQVVLSHPACHSRLRSVFHADDTGISVAHRARHVPTFVLASLCVGDGLSATGYAASASRLAASAQLATTAAFNRTRAGVNALLLDLRARVMTGTDSHMPLDAMGHMLGVLGVRMLAANGSGLREWLASPFVRALGVNVSMGAPRHRDRVRYNVDRSELMADGTASVLVNVWNALAPDASSPAAYSLTEHRLSAMLGLCSPPPALVFVLRCETMSSRHVDYVINCAESLLRHAAVCPSLRMPVVLATGRDAATVHYVDAVPGGGKAFGGLLALLTRCPTGGRLSDALLQVASGLHAGSSLLVVYEAKVLSGPVDSAETLSLLDAIVRRRSLTVDSVMLSAAGDLPQPAFPTDLDSAQADDAAVWQLSARSLGIALAAGDAAELALATAALRSTALRHNRVLLANAVFHKAAHRRTVSITVSPSCHAAVTVVVRTAGHTEVAELVELAPRVRMDCDSAGRLHVCTVERFSQPFAINVHSADESMHVQVFAAATDAYAEALPQLAYGRIWHSAGLECSVTFTSVFTGSHKRQMHCTSVKASNATEFVAHETLMGDGAVESIIGSSLSLAAPKPANTIGVEWLVNGKRTSAIAPSTEMTSVQFAMGQGAPSAVDKLHRAVYMYTLCAKNTSGAAAQPVVTSTLAHPTDYVTVPTCHGAYGHTACVTVVSTLNGSSSAGGSLAAPRSACADLHTAGALAAVDVTVPDIQLVYGSGSSPRVQCIALDTRELCEQSWSASARTRHARTLVVLTDPADAVVNVSVARTATGAGATRHGRSVWLMQANCCMRSLTVVARSSALSRLTATVELPVVTDWYSLADKRAKARVVEQFAWLFAAVFFITILCALLFVLFWLGKRYKARQSRESPRKYDVRKSKEGLVPSRDALKTTRL